MVSGIGTAVFIAQEVLLYQTALAVRVGTYALLQMWR
jgi:hypothetical protein